MTGFASIPLAEEGGGEHSNTRLAGVARVLGPRWLQLPALTIGLLGVQVFWSIEMSYGKTVVVTYSRVARINSAFKVHRTSYLWASPSLLLRRCFLLAQSQGCSYSPSSVHPLLLRNFHLLECCDTN